MVAPRGAGIKSAARFGRRWPALRGGHVLQGGAEAVDEGVDLPFGDHEGRRDVQRVAAQDARGDPVSQRRGDDPCRDPRVRGEPVRLDGDGRGQPDGPDLPDERQRMPAGGPRRPGRAPGSRPVATSPSRSRMSRLASAAAQAAACPEYV